MINASPACAPALMSASETAKALSVHDIVGRLERLVIAHELQPGLEQALRQRRRDGPAPISVADWTRADLDERIEAVRDLYVATLEDWPDGGLKLLGVKRKRK
jgi:hypothetical protein